MNIRIVAFAVFLLSQNALAGGTGAPTDEPGPVCEVDCTTADVPEPGSLILLGLGLAALSVVRRKK